MSQTSSIEHALTAALQRLAIQLPGLRLNFQAMASLAFRGRSDFEPADNEEGFRSRSGESLVDWVVRTVKDATWAVLPEEVPPGDVPAKAQSPSPLKGLSAEQKLDVANGAPLLARGIGGGND